MPPRVGLFITCLVDLVRPSVGFAAVRLLEAHGCTVDVPLQTCCGQPAYNSGDRASAIVIAREVVRTFSGFDYVVAPSGSCAAMLKVHYPALLAADDVAVSCDVERLAGRVYELTSFLTDVLGVTELAASHRGAVAYHDGCSGLRELGIRPQPRQLLRSIGGVDIKELSEPEACCGFGGTFAEKFATLSGAIADKKAACVMATGARVLTGGDLGCLLNIAGRLRRLGSEIECRHVAELLADEVSEPPIGYGPGEA